MGKVFRIFGVLVVLAIVGLAALYLLRPSPGHGAATLPRWVAAFDKARVDGPSRALLPFTLTGAGTAYSTLKQAAYNARSGDTIEIMPGTYTHDCGVVTVDALTIRALVPGTVTLEKEMCEGKAALVLRGGAVTVEGLRFRGYRADDANGAGIRAETGRILIRDSTFEDSDEGILGNRIPDGSITVLHSIFRGLGGCPPEKKCAHSIYIGEVGSVTIKDSLFERGAGGHYIKLRGPNVDVSDNLIDDSKGKATSYLIELPFGATGSINGNTLVKGPGAENRCCAIVVGAEGVKRRSTVSIQDNIAVNLTDRPVILLADLSGDAKLGQNATYGWFVRRSGMKYKDKCLGCGALR